MQVLSRVTLAGPQFVLLRSAARGLALSVAKLAQTCGQQPKSGEPPPGCPTHQIHQNPHTNWAANEEAAEENGISFLLPIGSVLVICFKITLTLK
jgi:hypothetical protein